MATSQKKGGGIRSKIGLILSEAFRFAPPVAEWVRRVVCGGDCSDEVTRIGEVSGNLAIQTARASPQELQVAKQLADMGYNVVVRSPVGTRVGGGTSDLLVNGMPYEIYSPFTTNPDRIISTLADKAAQAPALVLDLSRTTVTAQQLGNILTRVQGATTRQVIDIIILGGK
jgi:hypothetical protein